MNCDCFTFKILFHQINIVATLLTLNIVQNLAQAANLQWVVDEKAKEEKIFYVEPLSLARNVTQSI